MARLRYNGMATGSAGSLADITLSGAHNSSTTTLNFNAALTHSNGTAVPTLSGGDYFMLSILDSSGRLSEVVKVTAYTSGATSATVTRGQESTSGVSHASGDKVVHSATKNDALPARVKIDEVTLGANASSITFSSISQGYDDLEIVFIGKDTTATGSALVVLNGVADTGSNYKREIFYATGVTVAAGTASSNAAMAVAATESRSVLTFNGYKSSRFKTVSVRSDTPEDFGIYNYAMTWLSTAAITSISLQKATFAAGTWVRLYGLRDITE